MLTRCKDITKYIEFYKTPKINTLWHVFIVKACISTRYHFFVDLKVLLLLNIQHK